MRTEMRAQAGYPAHPVLVAQNTVKVYGKALLGVDEVVTRLV
jgi:hypothetical protein